MNKVEAIIRPEKLNDVKEALAEEILEHRLLKKSEILAGEDDI